MKRDFTAEEIMNIYIYYGSMENYNIEHKIHIGFPKKTYIDRTINKINENRKDKDIISEEIKEGYEISVKVDGLKECIDRGLIKPGLEVQDLLDKYDLIKRPKQKMR